MIAVIVHGAAGRMGRMVMELASRAPDAFGVRAGIEARGNALVGTTLDGVPIVDSFSKAHCFAASPDGPRPVLIDFTRPAPLASVAGPAADAGTAIVSGTTGLTDDAERALDEAARSVPVVWAPNMSLGVNVLYRLVAEAAAAFGNSADCSIVEMHHRHKVDAPSGTALRLAEVARRARPDGAREVEVHAARLGEIIGDHAVHFALDHEVVTLRHEALGRHVFAQGALAAARFAAAAAPGRYGMNDVLESLKNERG